MKRIDHTGERFGRLLVLKYLGSRLQGVTQTRKRAYYLCKCDCGNVVEKRGEALIGGTISCGCYHNEVTASINYIHGESNKTKEHKNWQHIQSRCYSPTNKKYTRYGARGIKVCEKWLNSYEAFLEDMGRAPSQKHSIDRIDNNGNYCPENCRWATNIEQANNKSTNVILSHNGVSKTMKQWAEHLGIGYKYLHAQLRYKNKSLAQIIYNGI